MSYFLGKIKVIDLIGDITKDNPVKYYNLLLRAKILEEIIGKVKQDEMVQFTHYSFRDYYVAKSLIGVFADKEVLARFFAKKEEHNSLILLCGIEQQPEIVHVILERLLELGKVNLAVDCFCNTFHDKLPGVQKKISDEMIQQFKKDKYYREHRLLWDISRYGHRILTRELENYIEEITQKNIILKIDWEILKCEKLNLGDIEDKYKRTFRYQYLKFLCPKEYHELYDRLANSSYAQNEEGFNLFRELQKVCSIDDLLVLVVNTKYNSKLRAHIVRELRGHSRDSEISIEKILDHLKTTQQFFRNECEEYRWEVTACRLYYLDYLQIEQNIIISDDDPIATDLVKQFWLESSESIQLRIVLNSGKLPQYIQFLIDLLGRYKSNKQVDIAHFFDLWEEEFFDEADFVSQEDFEILPVYKLKDFEEDTYEILIKCLALENLGNIQSSKSKELLVKYSSSENTKLRRVAELALNKTKPQEKQEYE